MESLPVSHPLGVLIKYGYPEERRARAHGPSPRLAINTLSRGRVNPEVVTRVRQCVYLPARDV